MHRIAPFLRTHARRIIGVACLVFAIISCYLGICTVLFVRYFTRADEPNGWLQPVVLGGLILCVSLYLAVVGVAILLPAQWQLPWWISARYLYFASKPLPLFRLARRYNCSGDVWTRDRCAVPQALYCINGGTPKLSHFFTGKSSVRAGDIDDVCSFLLGCTYVSDQEQFGVGEYWQHPTQFEVNRKGDCEDHALWAWRKLCDAGWNAEFIIGKRLSDETDGEKRHAWVILHRTHGDFLLETVAKNKSRVYLPLTEVRDKYVPYFSFDKACRPWLYGGYIEHWRHQAQHKQKPSTRADSF